MGAGHSLPGRKGGGALLQATRQGSGELVDQLLGRHPEASSYCTLDGVSSLHVAAAARRADLLERLLIALRQAGAARQPKAAARYVAKAVNQKTVPAGQTPLMLACKAGAADCVRLLLEAGADATLFDDGGSRTCLHYAALFGWAEAIDALLDDESVLATGGAAAGGGSAAQHQPRQLLREALVADSQGHHRYVDGRAGFGLAPLHLAAFQGHLAATKALLRWGASLTVRCNVAMSLGASEPWTPASTPLHLAAARGRGRVVLALLQASAERAAEGRLPGTDLRLLTDYRGQRPYDLAWSRGHRHLLSALNPRVPLSALRQPAAWAPAVPSLAALAAAALRKRLVQQLEELRVAAAAAAEAHARPSSRRGSRPGSREGSGHGMGAYAALAAAGAARLARLSGSVSPHYHSMAAGGGRARHQRHASDSGVGSVLQGFPVSPAPALQHGGSAHGGLAASRRAAASYAALCPPSPRVGAGGSSAFSAGALTLADAATAAPGSVVGCRTATSVSSVSGCPVCLCSALEVAAAPCGHGLCLDCAQHLSSADEGGAAGGTPLLCPLCRGVVAGFSLTG